MFSVQINYNVLGSVICIVTLVYVICSHLQSGDTPLHWAAYKDRVDAVKILHKYGGNMYCENKVS